MGILDAIKGQLIDVIEWSDNSGKTMVHKYDMNGKEIMMGAQLTVRESQVAIFVNEGELADVFEPGRYELKTSNMPILTALKSWTGTVLQNTGGPGKSSGGDRSRIRRRPGCWRRRKRP